VGGGRSILPPTRFDAFDIAPLGFPTDCHSRYIPPPTKPNYESEAVTDWLRNPPTEHPANQKIDRVKENKRAEEEHRVLTGAGTRIRIGAARELH
jgi:hypothetical protein